MNTISKFSIFLFILSSAVIGCDDDGNRNMTAGDSKDSVTIQRDISNVAPGPILLTELVIDNKTVTSN
ncbi:MAG TPA: hypothetical protein VFN95_06415, partial [Flavitalea sp.]|nr:hypothetical protein [Flavitalea sp.]